jgi:hypothetical protein
VEGMMAALKQARMLLVVRFWGDSIADHLEMIEQL